MCAPHVHRTRAARPIRFQASPDELAGVGESSRASAAPRATNPGGEWTVPVHAAAPSVGPTALESMVDSIARQEDGDDSELSSSTEGLRPLDQSNRRSRRNSREMVGLDAVPESTAGVLGGDASPLAALPPPSPLAPPPLPAIRTGGSPPKPVSSA